MSKQLPDFDLDGYLPYRLAITATRLSKDLAKLYRSKFDISIVEWRVLVNVGYSKKVSVRDIERRVSMEKSKVSRAASRLEALGYLTRKTDDADKRLLKLELTPKGIKLVSEIVPIAKAYQEKLMKILDKDFDVFQDSLGVLMALPPKDKDA